MKMKNKFYVLFPISNQITKFIKIYLHTSDEEGEEVLEALDEDEEEDDDEGSSPDIRKFIMFIKFHKLKFKKKKLKTQNATDCSKLILAMAFLEKI
jgi:hypothetical protein